MKKILRFLIATVLSLTAMATMITPSFAAETGPQTSSSTMAVPSWFHRSYVARVRVAAVNVRACGSTRCRIIAVYRRGTRVHVYYRWGGWSNIGRGRWIASYLLN